MHGGTADNAGENNGNYKHGLYAEIGLNDEERDLMKSVGDLESIEAFDLLLERELARYVRATGIVGDPEMVDETKMDPQGNIHKVGSHFEIKDGPLASRAGLISSILDNKSKAEHRRAKIEDGEKMNLDHSGQIDGKREHELSEEERELGLAALRARREMSDDE